MSTNEQNSIVNSSQPDKRAITASNGYILFQTVAFVPFFNHFISERSKKEQSVLKRGM